MTENMMTKEEKQNWLENASAVELMAHYAGVNLGISKAGITVEEWCKLNEDKIMAEVEIVKRMKKAESK